MSIVRLLLSMIVIGLALGLGLVGAAGLSGHGHRWVDILAQFTAPAFAGAVVLAAVSLMRGLRIGAAAALMAAIVTAVAAWPQWFPARAKPADAARLTIYSANLWAPNEDVEAMARSIREADADVLVLVEFGAAPAGAMERLLGGYPHRVASAPDHGARGVSQAVIASRLPLEPIARGVQPMAAARVDSPLGPVTVAAAHLTRPWPFFVQWEQIRQVGDLGEWAGRQEGPLVVAGDFNSVSSARIGRQTQADLGVTAAPGWPGTWPSFAPAPFRMTIDQVYVSRDLTVTRRRLGRANGSDHSPVIVELARAR